MSFFSRKSKELSKNQWDQTKFEYENAIERCYKWEKVSLSLCSFEKFVAFNLHDVFSGERKPFLEKNYEFHGVVYEQGQSQRHVPCVVEVQPENKHKDYIGEFVLTHTILDKKRRREEQPLVLQATFFDPTARLTAALIDALRDAALSGFRFIEIGLECQETTKEVLDKAFSDMRGQGFAATRNILSVKMWPKIELQNSPSWARRVD